MPGSQRGRSNPLAGRVTIHPASEYQGVRFVLGNQTERPITVAFTQPVPEGATTEQFRFQPERHGDAWTVAGDELSFEIEIPGDTKRQTGYALTDSDVEAVWNAINRGTVTVSDADGEVLGTVGDLEPNVVESADEPDGEDASVGDDGEEKRRSEGTAEATPKDEDESESEDRTDGQREEQENWENTEKSPETHPDPGSSATGGETADGPQETDDGESSMGAVDPTDVTALADELDSEPATDSTASAESGGEDSDGNVTVGSRGTERPDADYETAETADLPASRADYILSDVRGEIDSAAEFDWRWLREPSKPKQVLTKIRSWLGV